MNKVVFICLLSFALCYSLPADNSGKPTNEVTPKPPAPEKHDETTTTAPPTHLTEAPTKNLTTPVPNKDTENSTKVNPEDKTKTDKATTTPKPVDTTVKPDVKPDSKPEPKPEPTPDAKTNSTTVAPKDLTTKPNEVTTLKPVTTEVPSTTTKADVKPVIVQSRGFDGASFIGGMILTVGLLAVGFIGFKYYKNHAERNYHTL